MFSPLIQGYIDQSGKEAAMQRVQSIQSHVASIEKQLNPDAVTKTDKQTFAEILKASQKGEGQFRADGKNFLSLTSAANILQKLKCTKFFKIFCPFVVSLFPPWMLSFCPESYAN